jgi:galactose mutarotase-like enzyme
VSFSHREEKRGDRLLDILIDESGGSRMAVSRLGAEVVSWQRRDARGDWQGFLHRDGDLDAPEKGWANHATVMGYYLHRIKDQRTIYRGRVMEGGTHSFLRNKVWQLADLSADDGRLTYRITQDDYSEREYPLNVALELSYELADEALRVSFRFQNNEPELTAHVGFGLHPGFAATDFESFELEMPRGVYRRHFSPTNHLSGETQEITHHGGMMPFEGAKLPGSYILEFVDVPERTFTFRDQPSGRIVEVDLAGVPYVTLWSDGGPFLCIEPCWGLTDHEQQRAFEDKEGIQIIPAGGVLHASFSMSARFNP